MIEPYTVAITSCGRFDLLEQTLASLLPRLEGPVVKVVIVEDSGSSEVEIVVQKFAYTGINFEIVINTPALGHIRSIDRLYSQIDTEWIFHCEDDWAFCSDGFIADSFAVLKEVDSCSMVNLRVASDFSRYPVPPVDTTTTGTPFQVLRTSNGPYAGLNLNPGLRRMRDYRIVGSYASYGQWTTEKSLSQVHLKLGYRVAFLTKPALWHLGKYRRIPDQRTILTGGRQSRKWKRSILKRMEHLRLKFKGKDEPFAMAKNRFELAKSEMSRWIDYG